MVQLIQMEDLQKQTTLQQQRNGLTTQLQENKTRPASKFVKAIRDLQQMKGKCYTETLVKFWNPDVLEQKAIEYMDKLASIFEEYRVSDDELNAVIKQCRETEFTGTSYMPLPDEGALIRVIQDVQGRMAAKRITEPEKPKMKATPMEKGCVFEDGEVITRDAYFYRSMMRMTDIFSNAYPVEWIEEARVLMDDKHKVNLLYFRGQGKKPYLQTKGDMRHDTDR